MMWVCDYDHNPICYDAMKCPVCELQEQLMNYNEKDKLEGEIDGLEGEIGELQVNIQELEATVKQLEAQLEDLEQDRRKVG